MEENYDELSVDYATDPKGDIRTSSIRTQVIGAITGHCSPETANETYNMILSVVGETKSVYGEIKFVDE